MPCASPATARPHLARLSLDERGQQRAAEAEASRFGHRRAAGAGVVADDDVGHALEQRIAGLGRVGDGPAAPANRWPRTLPGI